MSTVEDRLREYYGDQPDTRAAEQRLLVTLTVAPTVQRARRGPAYAAVAAALTVALVAIGLFAFRHTSTTPNQTSTTRLPVPSKALTQAPPLTTVVTKIADVTIRHPTDWRYIPNEDDFGGAPLGYFSTQRARTQCHSTSDGFTCRSPVARLGPQDVFVEVAGGGGPGGLPQTTPSSTVAHYPGKITASQKTAGCPSGSTDTIAAVIQPLADNYYLRVCFNRPTQRQRAAAIALINSFRLHGATPCSGQCPAHPSRTTVRLTVGRRSYVLNTGANRPITVQPGVSIPIMVTINNSTRAPVTDPYLFLSGGTYTEYGGGRAPEGKIDILARHSGAMSPGETLSATWTPKPLFGKNRLDLNLQYSIGDQGTGSTVAVLILGS